jgi:hypothetical protein
MTDSASPSSATATATVNASTNITTGSNFSKERTGRVVRLHFSCRARLPRGSSLRVTGSSLWAPGTSAVDPADAAPAMARTSASAFACTEEEFGSEMLTTSHLYASSVEMVTSPETYPVWRTRKPVVVVIHHARKAVQHHYYRYLVVSPGGGYAHGTTTTSSSMGLTGSITELHDEEASDHSYVAEEGTLVSTSNETLGATTVMEWEDPFHTLLLSPKDRGLSALSLASSMQTTGLDDESRPSYRNLPYRTIDIDVPTGTVLRSSGDTSATTTTTASVTTSNENDEDRMDLWNNPDDRTYRPYLIREAVCALLVYLYFSLLV